MKLNHVYAGAALGLVVLVTADAVVTHRKESKKRKEIKADMANQIHAIHEGLAVVINRCQTGEYTSLEAMRQDYEFEKIIAYNKNK